MLHCTLRYVTYLLTYLIHVAESFLRSQPVYSYSGNSPHFMEPEGSLPHSQVPATCHYPEPARSSPYPTSHFLKIHLNIILPSTRGSPMYCTLPGKKKLSLDAGGEKHFNWKNLWQSARQNCNWKYQWQSCSKWTCGPRVWVPGCVHFNLLKTERNLL